MCLAKLWDTQMNKMLLKMMRTGTLPADCAPVSVPDAVETIVLITIQMDFITELSPVTLNGV